MQSIVPVEVVEADELPAELESPYGVAEVVERRRPEADAHHVGDDEDEGARHARLGRQADVEGELPRVVVHAAAVHQTQHIPDHVTGQHPNACSGAHTSIGQTSPQHGQGLTCDLHAAGLEYMRF